MASRLARNAVGAASRAALRPTVVPNRVVPAVSSAVTTARFQSNVPQEDPKQKANSIIASLPGSSTPAKIGFLSAAAGLSVAAISNEIYVVNEETIVMISLLSVYWGIYHYLGAGYASWADGYAQKLKDILSGARNEHKAAVQTRIDSLKGVGEVVDVTKSLFAVSKETAQLEAQAYELEQKTALAAEAKTVLDSWVRYEGQVKQRQQRELAESIISKIEKELQDPKVLKQILDQSVKDVERIVSSKAA